MPRFCQKRAQLVSGSGEVETGAARRVARRRCPHGEAGDTLERRERTELGYRRFRCHGCHRAFNERTGPRFTHRQSPTDVVGLVGLWRVRDKLRLRDLPELFLARGIIFTHEAVREGETQLAPLLSEMLGKHRRGGSGPSWDTDEAYSKVKGRWTYLYRASDRAGSLGDVLLSETRDKTAAEAFFRSARAVTDSVPERVTTDGHDAYPGAIKAELGEGPYAIGPIGT
jgi:putative transposase